MKQNEIKYFDVIGNFCEKAPMIEGYTAFHSALFLIIFDTCNKNFWKPTSIDYVYLMNKIGMNKRTYLKSRVWLQDNGFIKFTPGQNEYSKAVFEVAVQICTSSAPHHAPLVHLSYTAPRTSGAPSINKQLNNNNNQLNNKQGFASHDFFQKEEFNIFWTEFLNTKKRKKASLNEKILENQFKKLLKISKENYDVALSVLAKSVNSGWPDFYPPKKENEETPSTGEIGYKDFSHMLLSNQKNETE